MQTFGTESGSGFLAILLTLLTNVLCCQKDGTEYPNIYKYQYFPESDRLHMRRKAKEMFYFGYDNYIKHAFPLDELNPILCTGRGPDKENRDNINVNDALGEYSLTLIDSLDTLAILGNQSEFKNAITMIKDHVSFDRDNVVQVFEATIRVVGGLLAGHLLAIDPLEPFGQLRPVDYDDELLTLAHDLANRLLPAFENSKTNLPFPRVNLRDGVPDNCSVESCTAGVGTLVLEFGILSRLLSDSVFEDVARAAIDDLWSFRSEKTGLFGNTINIETGDWTSTMSGVGAGIDSFYEYLLKSYVMFGDEKDLTRFKEVYRNINRYMQRGRSFCLNGTGEVPMYVNVDMNSGETFNYWIDSLQAAFTGVQVLYGDLDKAICSHALYYGIWQRYGALPERFNWKQKTAIVNFYPLRPEFSESTYLLYQATKHPFYLHVGHDIITSLEAHAKAKCGYATLHDVHDRTQEDRMESFFLSETMKYLYLLFDFENPLNRDASSWIFSTEGHVFRLKSLYREKHDSNDDFQQARMPNRTNKESYCGMFKQNSHYSYLPLGEHYFTQIEKFVGL